MGTALGIFLGWYVLSGKVFRDLHDLTNQSNHK